MTVLLGTFLSGCAMWDGGSAASPQAEGLTLRNLEIDSIDGHRAVLLRLSGLPARVVHESASSPARIRVRMSGPAGDDFEEQALPQTDDVVAQVRVGRHDGALEVTLDLKGEVPPPYSVHEMADWVMIRLGGGSN